MQIWRCGLAGGVQRSSLSVKRTVPAFTGAEASATACPSHGRGVFFCRVGGVSPLRRRVGFPWRGGGLRRPHFFLRRKKCGKDSRLDLRSKGPLARGGQVQIWRYALAHEVQWVTLSVQGSLVPLAPLPLTAVRVGVGALVEWRLSNRAHCGAKHRNG